VSLDHLGEDTTSREQATAVADAYVALLGALAEGGLAGSTEVSIKLTALGLGLDPELAVANAQRVVSAATSVGTTVTVDMEDHTRTDDTLATVAALRAETPTVGAVIQAYLRRSEGDCRELAVAGSRVRLCKGAYREPASVAFQSRHEVDDSYRKCLRLLMSGPGRPMVATHDPAMIELALSLGRAPTEFEFQMLYGVRPDEQTRLAAAGHTVRVYVPYGQQWYGYLTRRLAERPANMGFFARALLSRS
jgi:proline dehydrogenase